MSQKELDKVKDVYILCIKHQVLLDCSELERTGLDKGCVDSVYETPGVAGFQ